jgi:hypothetical protein
LGRIRHLPQRKVRTFARRAYDGFGMRYPVPANETERLATVRALNVLDTAPEIAYDEIGELAAEACQCPVAYISFMDDVGSG